MKPWCMIPAFWEARARGKNTPRQGRSMNPAFLEACSLVAGRDAAEGLVVPLEWASR